jgi:hypothetical protein
MVRLVPHDVASFGSVAELRAWLEANGSPPRPRRRVRAARRSPGELPSAVTHSPHESRTAP